MPTLDEHFESPKALIRRAYEQIGEYERELADFGKIEPFIRIVDVDSEPGVEIHKIRITRDLPRKLSVIFGDISKNLRSALDHAVYGCAVALGVPHPKGTAFPIADHPNGVVGSLKAMKDLPAEIHPLLISFRPHEGGNRLIWGLNEVRNSNTHRLLVPFAKVGMANIMQASGILMNEGAIGYSEWNPSKNELEFMRCGIGSTISYTLTVSIGNTFDNVKTFQGSFAKETILEAAAEVNRIVLEIEKETAAILAARP